MSRMGSLPFRFTKSSIIPAPCRQGIQNQWPKSANHQPFITEERASRGSSRRLSNKAPPSRYRGLLSGDFGISKPEIISHQPSVFKAASRAAQSCAVLIAVDIDKTG